MLGLLSTLLFTLWPLLKIREIHPGAIFRRDAELATVEQETASVTMVGEMGTGRSIECRHGWRDYSRPLRTVGMASRFVVDRLPLSRRVVSRHRGPLSLCTGVRARAGLGAGAAAS